MNRSSYYLKQNVVAEPLVHGWYAWAHLIPPTTLSRNISERHVKIMESYIESPETHEAAVEDPKFLGGPFKDLKQTQVERVAELRSSPPQCTGGFCPSRCAVGAESPRIIHALAP